MKPLSPTLEDALCKALNGLPLPSFRDEKMPALLEEIGEAVADTAAAGASAALGARRLRLAELSFLHRAVVSSMHAERALAIARADGRREC